MNFFSTLKVIVLIVIGLLINTLFFEVFLFNFLNLNYLKNFKITDKIAWSYHLQIIVSLVAIFCSLYLILSLFMTEFLIFNSRSKYSDHCGLDDDEPHYVEKFFLSIIPILCLCIILMFTIQLIFFSSHYVLDKNLYHKTPAEYIQMKKEKKDKAVMTFLSSVKDKMGSKVFGGDLIKTYKDLPWDLLTIDPIKSNFYKLKFFKILTTGFMSCILLTLVFFRLNILGIL